MARANREYEIRQMVCDWALDIPMGDTTFVLHFNSRNNAELIKAVLEWEDAHPNAAVPYKPTLNPPNEWISVDERLPEKDGSYLVHSGKSNTVYAAHFWKRDGRWSGKSKNLFITHWQPLPEPPEKE